MLSGYGGLLAFDTISNNLVDTIDISIVGSGPIAFGQFIGQITCPCEQNINFATPPNQTGAKTYGGLHATASSGLPVTLTSLTPAVCTLNGNTATMVAIGQCTIQATQVGNAAYLPAPPVTQGFSVSKLN